MEQAEGEEEEEGGGSWTLGNLKQLLVLANIDTASVIDKKDLVATAKQYLDGLAKGHLPLRKPKPYIPPKDGYRGSGGAGGGDGGGADKVGGGSKGEDKERERVERLKAKGNDAFGKVCLYVYVYVCVFANDASMSMRVALALSLSLPPSECAASILNPKPSTLNSQP